MRIVAVGIAVMLAGCATSVPTPNVVMVNANGERQVCNASSAGPVGGAIAPLQQAIWGRSDADAAIVQCVRRWRELGYRPEGEQPQKIIVETRETKPPP